MPTSAACPQCQAPLQFPESAPGKAFRCPRCQAVFRTAIPVAETPPERPAARVDEGFGPTPVPRPAARPQPHPRPSPETSEPRRARPDANERPRSSLLPWLILGGVAALLFLIAGGGVLTYLAWQAWASPLASTPDGPGDAELAAAVAAIRPPMLDQEVTPVALPGPASEAVMGGGGRFLLLRLARQRQVAVFDANEAKVVKYLPLADDAVKMAAGRDKLFLVYTDKRMVQRWDLQSFEQEVTVPLPVQERVHTVAMGSASAGPLLLGGPEFRGSGLPLAFLDAQTLQQRKLTVIGRGHVGTHSEYPAHMRVSANGRLVGMWTPGLTPSGLQSVVLSDTQALVRHEHTSAGVLLPTPDGQFLMTGSGLFTPELQRLGMAPDPGQGAGLLIPGEHGPWSLTVRGGMGPNRDQKRSVTLHVGAVQRPLLTLPKLDGMEAPADPIGRQTSALPLDRRLILIPAAKLLLTLPETADKIYVRRFDPEEALDKSGLDTLLVMSLPPAQVTPGKEFLYRMQVRSRNGGVTYKLKTGPKGMRISPEGLVRWPVPADFAEPRTPVVLTVSDAAGQEVFHSFTLKVATTAERGPRGGPE